MTSFKLSYAQLLADVRQAYLDARRHKASRSYVKAFERDLDLNLRTLARELFSRSYVPRPSTCFIISDPKKREVFAAHFRDRIVHHLYYNYVGKLFERTFIQDSYSCIRGRGTHYGVRRLQGHIRSESRGFTRPCYVLKMDIRGYFMHIDRERLLDICLRSLRRMRFHKVVRHLPQRWDDVLDFDFIGYLTRAIVLLDPVAGCVMKGVAADWQGLPHDKSLFHSPKGKGLPIGNLTSQLFSNVYLNELDQFMKRDLRCRHYGRYVDDFYVVGSSRHALLQIAERARIFLRDHLGLECHMGKLKILSAWQGVEFLGAFVKPHRAYVSRSTLGRLSAKVRALHSVETQEPAHLQASLNSFCGVLSHWSNYRVRKRLFGEKCPFSCHGLFSASYLRFRTLEQVV